MRTFRLSMWAFLPIILFTHSAGSAAQTDCAAPEVKRGVNIIQISPTGIDDTKNLQCALDLAVEQKIPEIRLTRGEFFISSLTARGFNGTLQGGGRDYTRVTLLPGSIDCQATRAAITLVGGEPRIRWLSLVWPQGLQGLACIQEDRFLTTLIRVTGSNLDASSCGNDVIHATFDRVSLRGPFWGDPDYTTFSTGIRVAPSANDVPDCGNALLGSFRLNRSAISQFGAGIAVAMEGGAQLGVYGNSFERNNLGFVLENSDAIATVSGNRFLVRPAATFSTCHGSGHGMLAANRSPSEGRTRLQVLENTFELPESWPCGGFGVRLVQDSRAAVIGATIADNRFTTRSAEGGAIGIDAQGVSDAVVNGNTFDYEFGMGQAIAVNAYSCSGDVSAHWTIVTNTCEPETLCGIGIHLGECTRNALVGPGQRADVLDSGTENIVLPQQ